MVAKTSHEPDKTDDQAAPAGVEELDDTRLKSFSELKYSSIHDAKPVLGDLSVVRQRFIDFQQYLYC